MDGMLIKSCSRTPVAHLEVGTRCASDSMSAKSEFYSGFEFEVGMFQLPANLLGVLASVYLGVLLVFTIAFHKNLQQE